MRRRAFASMAMVALALLIDGCASAPGPALRDQVVATERAFARTMADRDAAAFAEFIAPEAIFYAGSTPLRGKPAVQAAWAKFFTARDAPFAWEPREVEVLDSGTLAISSGPVRNAAGTLVATFTSIWRLEPSGRWRIVFDKGAEVCECTAH